MFQSRSKYHNFTYSPPHCRGKHCLLNYIHSITSPKVCVEQHGPDKRSFLTCGGLGLGFMTWLTRCRWFLLRSCLVPSASSWASTRTRATRSQQTTDRLRPTDRRRGQTSAPTDTAEKAALSRAAKLPSYHSEQRLTRGQQRRM